MAFGKKNNGSSTTLSPPPEKNQTWIGAQLIVRAKGTNEITYRTFPFWTPTEKFVIEHAKQTNKQQGPDRTYWTHALFFCGVTDTARGLQHNFENYKEIKEVKI